jgi:hypothetical protein
MPSDRKRAPAPRLPEGEEHLIDDLEALAKRNGRSINDELIHAIKRHLAQPPTVRIEEPKLDPVEVEKPTKTQGKRNRSMK